MKIYDVRPLEGYIPEVGSLLAALHDSTREWRENLGSPTIKAIVWQPVAGFHSIGALMLHMIECESYWFETFARGRRPDPAELKQLMSKEIRQYGARWPTPPARPIAWYYELHDRIRSRALSALFDLDPELRYERKNFTCTWRWVVAHVLEHDSYHGGQAVLLHELWKKMGRP